MNSRQICNATTDLDPNHYRNNSSTQYALANDVLSRIVLKGTETILDIGCGDGRITAELSKRIPLGRVIGIDRSAAMIDLALHSFPKMEYPNLEFEKEAAEETKYPSSVDIALIMNALHWVRDPRRALQNVAAALRPDGKLFILTYPKESLYWQFLEETAREEEWWAAYEKLSAFRTIHTSQEYICMLMEMGMKIDQYSVEEQIAIYPTGEDLSNFIKGWLNCYLPLSKEHENEFLKNAVNRACLFYLSNTKGEIQLPYSKLTIEARKC